jgi:NAD(P)-dependent dehydrogenase (short-subunit alcohol dehydrogenase family)
VDERAIIALDQPYGFDEEARMENFQGKLAVITGAGNGMGRELALQLVAAGAHVAICDIYLDYLAETKAACEAIATGTRVSAHACDVAEEAQVIAFRDAVTSAHGSDHINLLFNNAGISGGGSFILDEREQWDRTFNVNWFGVYYCTRAFLPLLIKSSEGCIINTSSLNGFFARDPSGPHTAYSTSKFAIKGFSEALLTDLRDNAPHVQLALVMPGHIGTAIVANSVRGRNSAAAIEQIRKRLTRMQIPHAELSDDQVMALVQKFSDSFRDSAPLSAAQAATIILAGVRAKKWRILVGEDAQRLDKLAREYPEELYEPAFLKNVFTRFAQDAAAAAAGDSKTKPK